MALSLVPALLARSIVRPSPHHKAGVGIQLGSVFEAAAHELPARIGGSLRPRRLVRCGRTMEAGCIHLHRAAVYTHIALPLTHWQPRCRILSGAIRKTSCRRIIDEPDQRHAADERIDGR